VRRAATWLGVAACVTAGIAVAETPQHPPEFRSSVEAVYVDVFVTRDGRPVPGLDAAGFELKDNGVRQSIERIAAESVPLHAVLVFDTSSSLSGPRLRALKAAGQAFLAGLRPSDEVALVGFSEEVAWLAASTARKDAVSRALDGMEASGATSAFDALYAAVALSEESGRSLIVLFTDGEDNSSFLGAKQLATAVERSNALVHAVGWHERASPQVVPGVAAGYRASLPGGPLARAPVEPPETDDVRALRGIAEASGGRFWEADSPERLRRAFAAIADAMGHRYVLRYEPQGVKREGWHRLEIKLRDAKGDVQARHGYWVGSGPVPTDR
jgi:VWFA-related protein